MESEFKPEFLRMVIDDILDTVISRDNMMVHFIIHPSGTIHADVAPITVLEYDDEYDEESNGEYDGANYSV